MKLGIKKLSHVTCLCASEIPQCTLAVYLHHLPQLLQQVGLQADVATPTLQHCAASALVLLLPGILALGVDFASPLADLGMVASGAGLANLCPKCRA